MTMYIHAHVYHESHTQNLVPSGKLLLEIWFYPSSSVGLLAVSPAGCLYYWQNVLQDRPAQCVDGMVDVGVGHVLIATPLQAKGVILMTTEGRLFLVSLPTQSQVIPTIFV